MRTIAREWSNQNRRSAKLKIRSRFQRVQILVKSEAAKRMNRRDYDEHALFYAFQRVGALVVARGPGRLRCFEATGPEGAALLQRLTAATAIGNITAAIRNLGLDPAATMEAIFDLYDRGEIKLTRSPDKTLLFQTQELRNEQVQNIVDDIAKKVHKRLAGFEAFVDLIQAGLDVTEVLQQRFG